MFKENDIVQVIGGGVDDLLIRNAWKAVPKDIYGRITRFAPAGVGGPATPAGYYVELSLPDGRRAWVMASSLRAKKPKRTLPDWW